MCFHVVVFVTRIVDDNDEDGYNVCFINYFVFFFTGLKETAEDLVKRKKGWLNVL